MQLIEQLSQKLEVENGLHLLADLLQARVYNPAHDLAFPAEEA